jgi:hypothetical protein
MRACARRGQRTRSWRTGQSTGPVRCTTGQPRGPTSQSSNGQTPTVCWRGWGTGLSGAPCDCSLPTTIFGGWGYKYPNHPTFNGIQVFTLLHLTRASIQYKTHQRDQILSQLHTKALVIRESDLSCSFELLSLDRFFSFSFFLVKTQL